MIFLGTWGHVIIILILVALIMTIDNACSIVYKMEIIPFMPQAITLLPKASLLVTFFFIAELKPSSILVHI